MREDKSKHCFLCGVCVCVSVCVEGGGAGVGAGDYLFERYDSMPAMIMSRGASRPDPTH